jgi:hypothetical protein
MAKHTKTNGDDALEAAKMRRAEELEQLRATDPDFNDIVPADWVQRETGYPPYLVMAQGMKFRATVCRRDESDEFVDRVTGEVRTFVRYHMKLTAPAALACRRGPNDERGEEIPVQAGQIFTIGEYATLAQELNGLMGLEVAILCRRKTNTIDRDTGEPRSRYDFDAFVSPATERMLMSENAEDQKYLRDAYREARRLSLTNTFLIKTPERIATAVTA